jgi:gamma-glutamyltranspeptidase/glutathione hydrolase
LNRSGVADSDFFDIPLNELLSEAWAQEQADNIKFDRVLKPIEIPSGASEERKKHTGSSILIVDPQGNIAILSSTLGDAFGSALMVPGYGFFLNNLLTEFSEDFPLIQGPQTEGWVSGGERPRGPEAPTFVFREGKPSLLLDAYGSGDPAAVLLNALVQKIDLGASCAQAVEFPRLLAQDEVLYVESGLYDQGTVRLKLELLGHDLGKRDSIGLIQMVCFDEGSDKITGESDPRGNGQAAGF